MISYCYQLKSKPKFTELGRERMSDDFMELNDMELNYIYFGDETDSNDTSNNLDKEFALEKSLLYFKQFSTVRTFEVI